LIDKHDATEKSHRVMDVKPSGFSFNSCCHIQPSGLLFILIAKPDAAEKPHRVMDVKPSGL